jgi:hypothetical protein
MAIRSFIGYGLREKLPHHSSLTRIRQRWGEERFRKIFKRTVEACLTAKIATAEVVHIDASVIRANGASDRRARRSNGSMSWDSLAERHVEDVLSENQTDEGTEVERKGRQSAASTRKFARPIPMQQWPRLPATGDWSLVTSSTRPSMTRPGSFWTSKSRLDTNEGVALKRTSGTILRLRIEETAVFDGSRGAQDAPSWAL